jgi:hypothetical protein
MSGAATRDVILMLEMRNRPCQLILLYSAESTDKDSQPRIGFGTTILKSTSAPQIVAKHTRTSRSGELL